MLYGVLALSDGFGIFLLFPSGLLFDILEGLLINFEIAGALSFVAHRDLNNIHNLQCTLI